MSYVKINNVSDSLSSNFSLESFFFHSQAPGIIKVYKKMVLGEQVVISLLKVN